MIYKIERIKEYLEAIEHGFNFELRKTEMIGENESNTFFKIDPKRVVGHALAKLKGKANVHLLQLLVKTEIGEMNMDVLKIKKNISKDNN
jgi:hypothetical protein